MIVIHTRKKNENVEIQNLKLEIEKLKIKNEKLTRALSYVEGCLWDDFCFELPIVRELINYIRRTYNPNIN